MNRKTFSKIALFLSLFFSLSLVWLLPEKTIRAEALAGDRITVNNIYNLRAEPNTSSAVVGQNSRGQSFSVLAVVDGGETAFGNRWYQIAFNGGQAYLVVNDHEQVVTAPDATPTPTPPVEPTPPAGEISADWAAVLNSFPPSYRAQLTLLHNKYPNWNFVAKRIPHTLPWVVDLEIDNPSRNLVPITYTDYKKDDIIRDAGGWVSASRHAVAYIMDPRNNLSEDMIFQFESLTTSQAVTSDAALVEIFKGNSALTAMIPAIMKVGNEQGLLPLFLAARIKNEITEGNGIIDSARGDLIVTAKQLMDLRYTDSSRWPDLNQRYYNVFNIGAYQGSNPRLNGIIFAMGLNANDSMKARYSLPWDSQEKAIRGGSTYIRAGYIDRGQDTQYYQKYNVIAQDLANDIWHQYMGNIFAPRNEGLEQYRAYKAAGDLATAKTFSIPVYQDTAAQAAPYMTNNDGSWYTLPAETWTTVIPPTPLPTPEPTVQPTPVPTTEPTVQPTPAPTTEPTESQVPDALQRGDANGDGKLDILDMIALQRHIMNLNPLSGGKLTVADANKDGKIDILDMIALQRHIMKIQLIN